MSGVRVDSNGVVPPALLTPHLATELASKFRVANLSHPPLSDPKREPSPVVDFEANTTKMERSAIVERLILIGLTKKSLVNSITFKPFLVAVLVLGLLPAVD